MSVEIGAVRASASLDAAGIETGVRSARSHLRVLQGGFQQTSREALRSAEAMGRAWNDGMSKASSATKSQIEALTGLDRASKATSATSISWVSQLNRQAQSFDRLRASVDPLFASTKQYEAAVKKAEAAVQSGIVSQKEANRVTDLAAQKYLGLVPAAEQAAQAQEKAALKAKQLRGAYEAARASVDPLYASSRQYEAVQRQVNEAVAAGVVSQKEADAVLSRAAGQYLGVGTAATAYGKAAKVSTFHTSNLAAQFNDIGVMLAAGQNPLMLAVQQGTQVSQVLNQMGGKASILQGLSAGFMSMINPVSLSTIAIIAGGAALLQWGMSAFSAGGDADTLKKSIEELDSALSAVDKQLDLSKQSFADLRAEFFGSEEGVRSLINAQRDFDLSKVIEQAKSLHQELAKSFTSSGWGGSSRVEKLQSAFGLLGQETRDLAADLDAIGKANGLSAQLDATRHMREHFMAMVGSQDELTGSRAEFYEMLLLSEAALSRALAKQKEVESSVDAETRARMRQYEIYGASRVEADRLQSSADQLVLKYERQLGLQTAIAKHGKDSAEVEKLRRDAALRTVNALIEQEGLSGEAANRVREAALAAHDAEVNTAAAANALRDAETAARGLASAIAAAAGFSANLEGGVRILEAEVRALEQGADAAIASGLEAKRIRAENMRDAQVAAGQDRLIADAQLALDMAAIDRQGVLLAQKKALAEAARKSGKAGAAASRNSLAGIQAEILQRRTLLGMTEKQRKKYLSLIEVQRRLGKNAEKYSEAQIEGMADQLTELDKLEAGYRRLQDIHGDLADLLTDAIFDPDRAGDAAKDYVKQIAMEFARTQLVLPIVAQISGVLGLGQLVSGVGGVGGAGGGGSNPLGLLGNVAGLASGGGSFAAGIGSGLGGVLSGGGLGSSFANLGGLLSGSSGFSAGALGAALPAAGLVLGGIALLAKGLSRKYAGSGIRGSFGAEGFEGSSIDFYKGGFLRSNRTVYKDLDAELETALDQSIAGMVDGLETMSSALGLGTKSIADFNAEGFTIWTNGKSQEQIMSELQDQMLLTAEGMAELILTTDKFSKVGETAYETITRLGTGLLTANDAFDLLGRRQFGGTLLGGHRAADLVSSFGGADQFNAIVSGYFSAFYTESEQLEATTRRLSEQFSELGFVMPETRDGFRDLVEAQRLGTKEGREAYASLLGLAAGFDQLITASESATVAVDEVSEGLSDAARQQRASLRRQLLTLLGRDDKIRNMELRALDPANRALQERIWALQDEEAAIKAANAIRDERRGLRERLWKVLGKTDRLRARELAGLDASNRALQERIWRLEDEQDLISSLKDGVSAAMSAVSDTIGAEIDRINDSAQEQISRLSDDMAAASSRADAARNSVIGFIDEIEDSSVGAFLRMRDEIRQVIDARGAISEAQERSGYRAAQAQIIDFATGQEITEDALSRALGGLQTDSSRFFGSFSEYAFDTARTTQTLRELEAVTGDQLTEAEQQVAALRELYDVSEEGFSSLDAAVAALESETAKAEQLEREIQTLEGWRDTQIEVLEAQLSAAQEQVDAALGISNAVMSVEQALSGLNTSIGSLGSLTGGMSRDQLRTAALTGQTGNVSALWDYEQRILGSNRADLKAWEQKVFDGLKIQGFADGGTFGGGLRIVGEQGPEMEFTGPAHIANGSSTAGFFRAQEELVREIKALRRDNELLNKRLEAHARQININTGRTAHIQTDWDRNGTPAERSA